MDINIKSIMESQRQFFATGATFSIHFRIEQLKKLKALIEAYESEIITALKLDLNKPEMEAVISEVILVTNEIDYIINNLKKWMQPTNVGSSFPLCWPGHSAIHYEPYGSVLVIGPWNYPFMLIMSPLIGAMSAGNCAVVKPSEVASHTQELIIKLINQHFSPEYITAVRAGSQETNQLLEEKFDYIFFTGGTQVGKIVMQAAAKHLTPITLELGGKNPCIVDETANLDFAARRIAWGKLLNAGQICLAPDYLFVHHSRKDALIDKLKLAIDTFYGDNPAQSENYCRIINQKHFARIVNLMQKGTILYGGITHESDLYISPTLIDNVTWNDPIMQEEIFGPILPIFTYNNLDEVISFINSRLKPLALYLFTKNRQHEEKIINHVSFGGGCINDCILQIANCHLPFGGVGASGMGSYHGKFSFETFSHRKSVFKKRPAIDIGLEYPPFSKRKLSWLKRLVKW